MISRLDDLERSRLDSYETCVGSGSSARGWDLTTARSCANVLNSQDLEVFLQDLEVFLQDPEAFKGYYKAYKSISTRPRSI